MLIDEIMNMDFLFQYFDIEKLMNFSKRLAKTSQSKTWFKKKKFKSQFFCQRNDKILLKQKTLILKHMEKFLNAFGGHFILPWILLLEKKRKNQKTGVNGFRGLGFVVQQHTDTSIAYFSLITCREPFRRNSYVERRRTNVASSCDSSDVPSWKDKMHLLCHIKP
jgi:hypothetical protein